MGGLRGTLRFARALVAMNLRSSLALRGAFWLQAAFMALNNAAFFMTWWLLFERFPEIGGWRLSDVLTLFGVVASGYGASVVLAGGVRDLGRSIREGELDACLVQPKPVLLHLVASRTVASGWGDMTSGVIMLALSGALGPVSLPATLLAVASSACVFTASGVLVQSLAFWIDGMETFARQISEFTLTFSLYPRPLFSGEINVLLYTVLPAGFVGFLPAELVRAPSLALAVAALASALAWTLLALYVFERGLARYASGNRIGARQ
ncbi:MAG: ABC-2 family transporter protein [Myxococcota bacterium]